MKYWPNVKTMKLKIKQPLIFCYSSKNIVTLAIELRGCQTFSLVYLEKNTHTISSSLRIISKLVACLMHLGSVHLDRKLQCAPNKKNLFKNEQ